MVRRSVVIRAVVLALFAAGLVVADVSPVSATSPLATVQPALSPNDSPIEGTPVPIPLGTFVSILADTAVGKLFYSGVTTPDGTVAGGVAASSLTGTGMQLIPGSTDAKGLAIGPDGLVYAAEATAIIAINPSTLTISHTYPVTQDDACPTQLAFAGSQLWFTNACGDMPGLGVLVPASGAVTLDPTAASYPPTLIASIPGHPTELASFNWDGASTVDVLQISGTSLAATTPSAPIPYPVPQSISATADGTKILVDGTEYSTADLSIVGQYTLDNSDTLENGVYSPDGNYVAFSNLSEDVASFLTSGVELRRMVAPTSSGPGDPTAPAFSGLAWVGTTLASVFVDGSQNSPVVGFISDILQAPSTIALAAPATAKRGASFSFTGTLTNVQDPTGLRLSVSRRDLSGLVALAPVTVGAGGKFTITDTPPVGSTNVYTVSYAGSLHFGPVTQTASIAVSRDSSGLTVRTDQASYPVGATMTVTVHLGQHYNSSAVALYATPIGYAQRLIARGNVDASGNLVVRIKYSYSTSFIATYGGDYRFANSTVSTIARVVVRVLPSLRGGYGTSGSYTLFHAGSYATPGVQILPSKAGLCDFFIAQYYTGGQWVTGSSLPCGRLNAASTASASFTGRTGVPWRVEVGYHSDASSVGAASSWMYLRFV